MASTGSAPERIYIAGSAVVVGRDNILLDVPLVELVQHVHIILSRQDHFHSIQKNWQDISLV